MSALFDLLSRFRFGAPERTAAAGLCENPWGDGPGDGRHEAALSVQAPQPTGSDSFARVYTAFDASQPVAQADDLFGREEQMQHLVNAVLHRRNHGFVAGQRGSGKTSLARVFGQNLDPEGIVVLYGACEGGISFGELMRGYLEQLPASSLASGTEAEFQKRVADLPNHCTSSQATDLLARIRYSRLVIIGDEFDRVTDNEIRDKIALLMKLVSDARLPVRFVLIGDQDSYTSIARSHPSLLRHITYVPVDPLDQQAVIDLLRGCAEHCGMQFAAEALDLIAEVVCGSPYHARLFGLHAALEAKRKQEQRIGLAQAMAGVQHAFAEWTMLNPADGESLRRIAGGTHGDPEAYLRVAREAAAVSGQPAAGGREQRAAPAAPDALADFGSAVQTTDNGPRFREATAPQFLIALANVLARQSDGVQQENKVDA
jgi:energy-coupling factor transporter ATP-binding protein EcfA2